MRFSFGVYAQILKKCKGANVTQLELGKGLLGVFSEEASSLFGDSGISDLFNGKKNLNPDDAKCAESLDPETALERFQKRVLPLIDSPGLHHAVNAVKDAIASDASISNETVIDRIDGLTKIEAMRDKSLDPSRFLSGVLLYVSAAVPNRGTYESCKQVTDGFMRLSAIGKADHVRVLWREGCNSLTAQEGDLFSLAGEGAPTRRIVVIPVDTGFCTRIQNSLEAQEPGLVSENTLHGKFLIRMESSGIDSSELEMRIASNLSKQGLACPGERGEGRSFPIGTVAVIDAADASYFLLAVSTLDVKGGAFSCEEDVRLAMRKLIAFYDRNGQGYSMFVPLVGTGRSRAHLSFSKSYELISEVFIDNSEHIQGDVRIVMLPQAWQEVFSSWGGGGDDAL